MLASFLKVPKMWPPKRLKIDVFDNPTIVLHAPPLQVTPANIRINLTRQRRHWATSSSLIVCVYLHSDYHMLGAERSMRFETECVIALQDHPRSLILAPIESAYETSYWSSMVTLVLSCPLSEILQVSCWELPHPYSTRILGVFALD